MYHKSLYRSFDILQLTLARNRTYLKRKCKKDGGSKEAFFPGGLLWLPQASGPEPDSCCLRGWEAGSSFRDGVLCTASWGEISKTPRDVLGTPHPLVWQGRTALGMSLSWRLGSVGVRGGSREPGGKTSLGIDPINIAYCFEKHWGSPARAYPGVLCALGWVQGIVIGCFYGFCLGRDSTTLCSPTVKSSVLTAHTASL